MKPYKISEERKLVKDERECKVIFEWKGHLEEALVIFEMKGYLEETNESGSEE